MYSSFTAVCNHFILCLHLLAKGSRLHSFRTLHAPVHIMTVQNVFYILSLYEWIKWLIDLLLFVVDHWCYFHSAMSYNYAAHLQQILLRWQHVKTRILNSKVSHLVVTQNAVNVNWSFPRKWHRWCSARDIHESNRCTWNYTCVTYPHNIFLNTVVHMLIIIQPTYVPVIPGQLDDAAWWYSMTG